MVCAQANKGMARGPGVREFDAAMMAQQAPPKNPPRKISTQAAPRSAEVLKWRPIERMAWDQKGRDVDIYVRLVLSSASPLRPDSKA